MISQNDSNDEWGKQNQNNMKGWIKGRQRKAKHKKQPTPKFFRYLVEIEAWLLRKITITVFNIVQTTEYNMQ